MPKGFLRRAPLGIDRVALTACRDGVDVSTVGLPMPPGGFETAIFDGEKLADVVDRYRNREEAEAGHARHVAAHGGPLPEGSDA